MTGPAAHMRYKPGTRNAERWPGCTVVPEGGGLARDIAAVSPNEWDIHDAAHCPNPSYVHPPIT